MSLSRYYRVFGLPETATEAEIKQRYRQLAMRYHPDKQGGDDRKFIEIKEAYEYLTGKKTVSVTTQTYTSRSTSHTRQQSQEERIKQAQQRKRENEYKEYVENERYFQSLTSGKKWRFLKTMAYVGLVLSILLIIDFNLPYKYDYEFIKAYRPANAQGMGGTPVRLIYTESGKSFYVEDMLSFLRTEPEMFLVKSTIFHNEIGFVPMSRMLLNQNIEHSTIFHIHFTLGAHSRWLLLFFVLPFIVISFKRRTYTFTTAYFLSLYLSCPLILIYLFTNERWLHVLTLGYV